MIAIGMNGAQLSDTHGFPARLITPGLYGFVGATKWLTKLTLTTYAADQAYWTKRQWATDAPIKTSARIDTPAPLSTIKAGTTAIGGVAWAQHRGVGKVEVKIDDGRLAADEARPRRRHRLLAPVVPPVGRQARPAPHRRARDRPQGTGADHRTRHAVPQRVERHPGGGGDRRVNAYDREPAKKLVRQAIRSHSGTESPMTVHHTATHKE